jgi:hypothetical protein
MQVNLTVLVVGCAVLSLAAQSPEVPRSRGLETSGRPGFRATGGGSGRTSRGLPLIAARMLSEGDKDGDRALSKTELSALADLWFDKLDSAGTGQLSQEQLTSKLRELFVPGTNTPGTRPGGMSGAVSPEVLGPILFSATDADKNASLTRAEFKQAFETWFDAWDSDKSGKLTEDSLRKGLETALPRPDAVARGGEAAGPPGAASAARSSGAGRPREDAARTSRQPTPNENTLRTSAVGTNQPSGSKRSYEAFKLIVDRNIFNPNRRASRTREGEEPRTKRTDTISLVGTLVSDQASHAFFDGTSPEYKVVLGPGKTVVGYKVGAITGSGVRLENGTNTLELRVGMQLNREEGGEWQLARGSAPELTQSAASSSSSPDTSGGDDGDIIKRLMQQREQELK